MPKSEIYKLAVCAVIETQNGEGGLTGDELCAALHELSEQWDYYKRQEAREAKQKEANGNA